MSIRCRQQDVNLVKEAINPAIQEYREATGRDVNVKLETDNFIASDTLVLNMNELLN